MILIVNFSNGEKFLFRFWFPVAYSNSDNRKCIYNDRNGNNDCILRKGDHKFSQF